MSPRHSLLVSFLVGCGGSASAPEPRSVPPLPVDSVAVLPLAGKGGADPKIVEVADDLVLSALQRGAGGQLRILGKSDIDALLGFERTKDLAGCDDVSCYSEISRGLGVESLIVPALGALGSKYVLTLAWLTPAADVLNRHSEDLGASPDELGGGIERAVTALVSGAGRDASRAGGPGGTSGGDRGAADGDPPSFAPAKEHKVVALTSTVYTLADLEALAKQELWAEVLAHMQDVPPRERGDAWLALTERAATAYVDAAGRSEPLAGVGAAESLIASFTFLTKSTAFMGKRAAYGLAGFETCFATGYGVDSCIDQLTQFVSRDPHSGDLAFEAGKLVRKHARQRAAVPFFKTALDKDPARCGDAAVGEAIADALGLPTDYDWAVAARALAFETCWPASKPTVMAGFYAAGSGGYYFANTCEPLIAKKALTEFQKAHCADVAPRGE